MISQVRAELLKVRSTRTTLGLMLGMVALILLFSLLTGLLASAINLSTREEQRTFLSLGDLAGVFSALAGAMLVTSEYRHGTMRPTILFTPHRSRVLGAKLIAGMLAGLVFGVVGHVLGWALSYVILSGRGISIVLTAKDIELLVFGGLVSVALWGAIGAGLGAIVRNQVGTLLTLLAWGFVVSPLLFGLLPSVGRFMPSYAGDALIGLTVQHLLSEAAGGAVLVGWTVLLAALGLAFTAKRDVS